MAFFSWNGATKIESWVVYTSNANNPRTWTNVTVARRSGFETTVELSDVQLEGFVRGKAVSSDGTASGWTMASDGNELYDAPDDVDETGLATTPTSSASSASNPAPSNTEAVPSSTSSDAAARATHGVTEQVYVAVVVVVGGLALA
ncbi:hypothetical protein G6011_02206 [Alternaria panax]|uniref:Uncharacterized protein n=1 Tax=Alternaria panax TaxID=48097 RepID=A0AAD4FG47_9PLEO|nr:hypothetical protein G6011_02206 [Alternaria panax]